MAGKDAATSLVVSALVLQYLTTFVVASVHGEGAVGAICPSIETCASQGRSPCVNPAKGCGPCIARYFAEVGNTCQRRTEHEGGQEGVPEIETIVRRVEQTRRSDGGSTPLSTKGKVVVDKTETRVKTDHQIVHPNGETTHLERENVETVEETKPADDDPVEGAPADEGAAVAKDPPPQDDGVNAAVRSGDDVDTDISKQQEAPVAHDGEILLEDWQFILIVCGCVAVGVLGIAVAFLCWYKIQTTAKAQSEAEYPAYGLTGPSAHTPSNMSNGDRKLAQSAQMYHYQHQKQQMIAMEKREKGEMQHNASDYDSEEENEDGDLTVYECPGLAPTGEMQVKNPLFNEDRHSEPTQEAEEEKQ